jgi:hypothetical protein
MSRIATVYDVLISGPSDVQKERLTVQEAIHAWNAAHSADAGAVLLPVMWETHATPSLADPPQAVIDRQIVENADILVGIFWTRLGTPTGEVESGSVEEIKKFVAKGKPVLLYFSSAPVVLESVDPDQYRRLKEFKESIRNQGLVYDFQSPLELRDALYRHLPSTVRDLQKKTTNQSTSTPSGTTAPLTTSQTASALAQGYETFARRLEVEWAAERDSGTIGIDRGKFILDRARQQLLDFRSEPRVAENIQLANQLDTIIRDISALQQHRLYIDGDQSFRQFWEAGNAIVREVVEAKDLIGITEERLAPLRQKADHDIGLALAANAEERTYMVVGAMILRRKQEDRWTTPEVQSLRTALYSFVSDRRVKVGTAASIIVAEPIDPKTDVHIWVSFSAAGVATLVFGWRADPFPVGSAVAGLLVGVRTLLHEKLLEAYAPIAPMEVTLGVVNWPEHGLSVGDLWSIGRPQPIGSLKGRRVHRKFSLSPDAPPWTVVGPFVSYLLADAGFVGYERFLDKPPPHSTLVQYLAETGLLLTA